MRAALAFAPLLVVGCGTSTGAPPDLGAGDLADAALPAPGARMPVDAPLASLCGIAGQVPLGADAASMAARTAYFDRLKDLGAPRLRTDLTWSLVEPMRGQRDFRAVDRLFAEAKAAGVAIDPILDYGNPWATKGARDDKYPPDDPADFAAFAAAAAARYGDRVAGFEIWNEPNAGFRFWKSAPAGDPIGYARLLAAAAAAIHAAVPSAKVAFAGTVFTPEIIPGAIDFDGQALDAPSQPGKRIDLMGMHAYENYPPSTPPEFRNDTELPLDEKVTAISALLAARGLPAMPIWLTEIGWPVTAKVSLADQASYMVRATLLAAHAGAARIDWYTLYDGPHPDQYPPEDAFGLMAYDPMPGLDAPPATKPAYLALRNLLRVGGDLVVQPTTSLVAPSGGARAIELRNGARRVVAVWADGSGDSPSVTITGCSPMSASDLSGQPVALPGVSLVPTGAPVYLAFDCP